MLRATGVAKSFGASEVLREVSLFIGPGERIGLVGPNGAGKTTLFRLLAGLESPDQGTVTREGRDVRVGLLPQEIVPQEEGTVLGKVLEARGHLPAMEAEMRELEEGMAREAASGAGDLALAAMKQRYGELQERFEREGGFDYEARAAAILFGLGFHQEDLDRPLRTLSGGWRMRLALARLLFERPNILLLDEPTNHLDLDAVLWLEAHLQEYPGAFLLVSHDRVLLNRLVRRIFELSLGRLEVYAGNYDRYEAERRKRREITLAAKRRQDERIRQIEDFVARNRVRKDRARQAQSRLKMLERMERIEVEPEEKAIRFTFPQPARSGQEVLRLRGVTQSYGERTIYRGLDLLLTRGERIALVGENGAGKTTLLKILAGVLPFQAGVRQPGANVEIFYYAQHQLEALDPQRTVLEEMVRVADVETVRLVRDILGAFRFTGDEVNKKVAILSGGEKSRLALARMLLRPANLILMDEPTNHLDMPSREVLESALADFQGTLCFISHDRFFINQVANKVIHVTGGRLQVYPGNFDYYLEKSRSLAASRGSATPGAAEVAARPAPGVPGAFSPGEGTAAGAGGGSAARSSAAGLGSPPAAGMPGPSSREERKARRQEAARQRDQLHRSTAGLRGRVRELEKEVAELERRLEEIQKAMADPAWYSDGGRMKALSAALERVKGELAGAYRRWEEASQKLEEALGGE